MKARRPMPQGMIRAVAAACLLAMAAGCGSLSVPEPAGRILVVDGSGAPLQGAVIFPDYEYSSSQKTYTREDIDALSSDAQGVIHADLDDYLWDKDGCYHFVIRRAGYDAATMSVSKDLLPPVLKVVMVPKSSPSPTPAPPAGR
jgi:hypothetical protein